MIKSGIDIVEISRFKNKPDKFFSGIYTKQEIEYCNKYETPAIHFAGMFAVKECVMKVLGLGVDRISPLDIEVFHNEQKKPYVALYGKATEYFNRLNLSELDISISHTKETAIAVCVAI